MRKTIALFAIALALTNCDRETNHASRLTPEALKQGFINPPASAKPHTWWHWMDGNITKEGITADLEAMADAGVGGAQIFNVAGDIPPGPVLFNSPELFEMIRHADAEARRLGLELCIHNCAGWANSGGPWNTPENSMKIVVTSEMQVKGPAQVAVAPPQPEANLDFYRDIAVLAFRTPATDAGEPAIAALKAKLFVERNDIPYEAPRDMSPEMVIPHDGVVDLTEKLLASGGKTIAWDAPEGDWTILRAGYTTNSHRNSPARPEGQGLECDKLSREAVKAHWNGHVGRVLAAIGKTGGPSGPGLNNVLIDSYEVGTQNWTQGFEREFQARCGYPILRFLPVFTGRIVESPEVTERFLWDLRRVIADLFAESYSDCFGQLAHQAGLLFSLECYGNSPSDDIQFGSYSDIPMGEFWVDPGRGVSSGNAKLPASVAHVYGKKFVGAEAFTAAPDAGKWQKGPFELKAQGDAVYCGGVNRMIYHRYAHQPWTDPTRYPGMTMGQWGTHFDRTLTWWEQGKEWLRYQARCQYMLQEGRFVADVLFYSGEGAPNGLQNRHLPYGYDFDGCDTRALKMLKVKDGRLVLPSGMSYRILVLPDDPVMSPEALEVIRRLVRDGAAVVGKNKPERAPGLRGYPSVDAKVKQLADEVWPEVISGKSPAEALKWLDVKPDLSVIEEAEVRYIHREIGGMDVYFVACSEPAGLEVECTFRVSGRAPEFWHPDTGETETVPVYEEKDGLTSAPIRFGPSGSVFVVFRKPKTGSGGGTGDHAVAVKYTAAVRDVPKYIGDLRILKAEYGYFADESVVNCVNITEIVRKSVADGNLTVSAHNDRLGGDPAQGYYKQLRIDCRTGGANKRVEINENQSVTLPPDAEIVRVYYGVLANIPKEEPAPRITDVTARLKSLVTNGAVTVTVGNDLTDGKDPAPESKKEIRVEYLYDGERYWAKAKESRPLILPVEPDDFLPAPAYELCATANGNVEIQAWEAGAFGVTMASGKTFSVETGSLPDIMEIDGPWQLSFPPNWGAPAQVTLDRLISWTEYPDDGVKYFSGTATYDKTFRWEAKPDAGLRVILDLGMLKNFAEVTLNGKSFPTLWKPPYCLDITGIVKPGENALQVKITNMWPNRLIGDEQLSDDREWEGFKLKEWPQWALDGKPSPTGRYTFTTWHHWKKEDKPFPSGLFGPVQIRQVKRIFINQI
ncbi:MAG: hypothetical protein LBJ47_00675 [Tannerella sp.]|jgi:hypothetical protein|nr:hypothetical protein [Tannerella sp.]